jgi:hypothetical protein
LGATTNIEWSYQWPLEGYVLLFDIFSGILGVCVWNRHWLTIQQVGDRDPDLLQVHFEQTFGSKLATWHLAVEQHLDGGSHWHVIARFKTAPSGRAGMRQFDVDGVHPNVTM